MSTNRKWSAVKLPILVFTLYIFFQSTSLFANDLESYENTLDFHAQKWVPGFPNGFYRVYTADANSDGVLDYKVYIGVFGSVGLGNSVYTTGNIEIDSIIDSRKAPELTAGGFSEGVFKENSSYTYYVISKNGTFDFDVQGDIGSNVTWTTHSYASMLGDINGDGMNDLVLRASESKPSGVKSFSLLFNLLNTSLNGSTLYFSAPEFGQILDENIFGFEFESVSWLSLEDANRDGNADLVSKRDGIPELFSFSNNGIFSPSIPEIPYDYKGAEFLTECDTTGDLQLEGQEYYWNNDCDQVFILPPNQGERTISNIKPHVNLEFCPAMLNIIEQDKDIVNEIVSASHETVELLLTRFSSEEYKVLNTAYKEARDDYNFVKTPLVTRSEVNLKRANIVVNSAEIDYQLCFFCASGAQILEEKKGIYQDRKVQLDEAILAQSKSAERVSTTKQEKEGHVNDSVARENELSTIIQDLVKLKKNELIRYSEMEALEGATITFDINLGLTAHLASIEPSSVSPQFDLMPVTGFTLNPGVAVLGAHQVSPILWANVENIAIPAISNLLWDSKKQEFSLPNIVKIDTGIALSVMCQHYPEGFPAGDLGEISSSSMSELVNLIAPNATIRYQTHMNRDYRISYNLKNLVQELLKKSGNANLLESDVYLFIRMVLRGTYPEDYVAGISESISLEDIQLILNSINDDEWLRISFIDKVNNNNSLADQEEVRRVIKSQLIDSVISVLTNNQPTYNGCGNDTTQVDCLNKIFISFDNTIIDHFEQQNEGWVTESNHNDTYIYGSHFMNFPADAGVADPATKEVVTIDFSPATLPNGSRCENQPFTKEGYIFSPVTNCGFAISNHDGTGNVWLSLLGNGASSTLTSPNNTSFTMYSMDIGEYSTVFDHPQTLQVSCVKKGVATHISIDLDGVITDSNDKFQTFQLEDQCTDIDEFRFDSLMSIDNIVLSSL